MKFSQLSIGQRFRLGGEIYVKTGPLTANGEAGGKQRLIPRASRVEPVSSSSGERARSAGGSEWVPFAVVTQALDQYHQECLQLLEALAQELGDSACDAARERVAEAERRYREAISRAVASAG